MYKCENVISLICENPRLFSPNFQNTQFGYLELDLQYNLQATFAVPCMPFTCTKPKEINEVNRR